jgi:hypothetical protein
MEEADDGTHLPPLDRSGVDDMLRQLFPDLDPAVVRRVLSLDIEADAEPGIEEEGERP